MGVKGKAALDDLLTASISASVKQGNFVTTAAATHRVSVVTLRRWLLRGREDIAQGVESVYSRFAVEIESAEGSAECELVRMGWAVATDKDVGHDPRMIMWLLERRHAARWGQRAGLVEGEQLSEAPSADQVRSQPTEELARKLKVAAELLEE